MIKVRDNGNLAVIVGMGSEIMNVCSAIKVMMHHTYGTKWTKRNFRL